MILLFGQHPQGSMADRQHPLHARVGSIGDLTPPLPTPPIAGGGGGGYYHEPVYVRRQSITTSTPQFEEDLIAALTIFTLLENDRHDPT